MKDPRDIILAPVVSEKSYGLIEHGVYTFKVHPSASKPEISDAVEGDLGRRRRAGQHPQPEGQSDAWSSQQSFRLQARHQAGTRQAGGGPRDPAVRELS